MKTISLVLLLSLFSSIAAAGVCKDSIRLKSVFLSEKRVEIETKKEGVTYGQIIECLTINSDQVGDFRFEKPTKEEAARTFPKGKRVVVSRDEYDPHYWIAAYTHKSEHLRDSTAGSEVRLLQVSQAITLTHISRLSDNTRLDLTAGLLITRAHLIEPDTSIDAANDAAPTAGLRLKVRTAPRQEFFLGSYFDRFYILDTNDDKFIYRGHAFVGWEGMLSDQLIIGLNAGMNALTEGGSTGTEAGLQFKFRIENVSFVLGSQYETVTTDDSTLRGFAHSVGMQVLF